MKQAMMGWQWHQLDHMQIICTSLQTDNHASISSLNFSLDEWMSSEVLAWLSVWSEVQMIC